MIIARIVQYLNDDLGIVRTDVTNHARQQLMKVRTLVSVDLEPVRPEGISDDALGILLDGSNCTSTWPNHASYSSAIAQ